MAGKWTYRKYGNTTEYRVYRRQLFHAKPITLDHLGVEKLRKCPKCKQDIVIRTFWDWPSWNAGTRVWRKAHDCGAILVVIASNTAEKP